MEEITAEEYLKMVGTNEPTTVPTSKANKYGAVKTEIDGYIFASKAEAKRYSYLKIMEKAGHITSLVIHPVYPLEINGIKIGRFTADFEYNDEHGMVVEDVKGGKATKTEAYSLRKRVFEACYGIKLTEIGAK